MKLVTGILPEEIDRITVPPFLAKAGWGFNRSAILDAMNLLGIRRNLKLRFSSGKWTHGSHRTGQSWNEPFRIVVNQNHSIEYANETLWHELAHEKQAEEWALRTGQEIQMFYRYAYRDGVSYRQKIWEIHAERIATLNAHVMLLVEK